MNREALLKMFPPSALQKKEEQDAKKRLEDPPLCKVKVKTVVE